MTFQPSSATQHDYASPTVSLAALRARVSSATLSLHQTLDEVMGTFDQHLQELNKLRESLRESEKALQTAAPAVAALLPTMPALPPQAPMTSPQPAAKPFVPAPRAQPAKMGGAPIMTQVLWPSLPTTPPPALPSEDLKAAARPAEPPLEEATLEELNAALAYAFAQVSGTKPLTQESITHMMPGPLPTSALRYGNPAELSGRP